MKRILALGLSALLCASCLAGCSKDKDESKPGEGKVTLKVVTQFGGEDPATPVFEQQIKDWEKKTGNKITNDSTKADNVWNMPAVLLIWHLPAVVIRLSLRQKTIYSIMVEKVFSRKKIHALKPA